MCTAVLRLVYFSSDRASCMWLLLGVALQHSRWRWLRVGVADRVIRHSERFVCVGASPLLLLVMVVCVCFFCLVASCVVAYAALLLPRAALLWPPASWCYRATCHPLLCLFLLCVSLPRCVSCYYLKQLTLSQAQDLVWATWVYLPERGIPWQKTASRYLPLGFVVPSTVRIT